jgi:hypothetical protein
MSKSDDSDNNNKGSSACPVHSEWVRHLLYIGGMVALHTGLGASFHSASKHKDAKCPVNETARHLVYVGGFIALAIKAGMAHTSVKSIEEQDNKKADKCPINELYCHVIYVAGIFGIIAMIEARKK